MKQAAWSERDIGFMQAALVEARAAAAAGEVPVGAVVVLDNVIIASAANNSLRANDPGGHAELVALRAAGKVQKNHRLLNATLYVTLEPCVMCTGAIVQARLGRVVFAAYDAKAGALGSALDLTESPAFNHRFEVNGGVLADEASALLKEFFAARR